MESDHTAPAKTIADVWTARDTMLRLRTRPLGESGLDLPEISLGSMTFGGLQERGLGVDRATANRLVSIAIERGVRLFDTADVYNQGNAEKVLGHCLKGRREDLLVSSKVFFPVDPSGGCGLSGPRIARACEESLRRLSRECIDLYQLHCYDPTTPLEETFEQLSTLTEQGKIRYCGCCNFAGWQTMKAAMTARQFSSLSFVSLQGHYSALHRNAENEMFPVCNDQGLGFLAWGPLCGGLLSGKYARGEKKIGRGRLDHQPNKHLPSSQERAREVLAILKLVAVETGLSAAQVATAYVLSRAEVSSVIVGVTCEEQLLEALEAACLEFDVTAMAELRPFCHADQAYPYGMLARGAAKLRPSHHRTERGRKA